jgi:hypothetical protein
MKSGRIVGVGCFGKPETLDHLFSRVLKGYFLGDMEKITGFFLAPDEDSINLCVFIRGREHRRKLLFEQ